jgi:hypothetical protein
MGAFLRNLGGLDRKYEDPSELQRLRRRLCQSFVRVLAGAAPSTLHIHLCLSFSEGEPQCNADALVRAFAAKSAEASKLKPRVTVYPGGEAMQLASELASSSQHVALLNGANRKLLGNHWFGGDARRAIDENLHRRSWRMSAVSYMVNNHGGHDAKRRAPDELLQNVEWLGGRVHKIRHESGRATREQPIESHAKASWSSEQTKASIAHDLPRSHAH